MLCFCMDYKYLAGLIDGEGTSTINWQLNKRTGFLSPTPLISMALKPSKREVNLMYSLKEEFGGSIYPTRSGKGDLIAWRVADRNQVKKILLGVIPHLHLRREECGLLLDALKVIEEDKERFVSGFNKKTILKLAEITEKIRAYNLSKRKAKVWTYGKIKDYVDSSPLYSEEYRLMRKDFFLKHGVKTRFVKGRAFPEEIEEKRLTKLKEALKTRRKYSDETVKEARRLYAEGYKITVIAKMINANKDTVYDWLRRGKRLC